MSLCPAPVAPPTDDHPLIGNLTDCTYFALFGTSVASIANLVPGGDAATVIGAPAYGADYISLNSNAAATLGGLQLPASCIPQEGDDQLYIALATRETSGAYIANNGTNANGQVVDENGLFGGTLGPRFKNGQLSDVGQAYGVWPSNTANYYFIAGYGQARGHSFLQVGNAGNIGIVYGGSDLADRAKAAESAPLLVNPDAEGNIETRFAALACFKRMPDLGELQTIYTAMRTYFNGRGNIVVV